MKRISTILLTFQLLTFHGQLEALFDIKKFRQGEQHFVETYLYIFGPSLLEDRDTNVKNKKVEIYKGSKPALKCLRKVCRKGFWKITFPRLLRRFLRSN